MLKKVLIGTMVLGTVAFASEFGNANYFLEKAKVENSNKEANTKKEPIEKEYPYFFVGYGLNTTTFDSGNNNSIEFGGGYDWLEEGGVIAGGRLSIGYSKMGDNDTIKATVEGKFGWNFISPASAYLLLGYRFSTIDGIYDSLAAYGFGTGIGTEYHFNDSLALSLEYSIYKMNPDDSLLNNVKVPNYDDKTFGLKLIYSY